MSIQPRPGDSDPEPVTAATADVDRACEDGRAATRDGDYDAAIEHFSRAASIDPGSHDAVWGLAEAWHYKEDIDRARDWYGRYLELCPGNPEASHMIAALGEGRPPPRAGDAYVRALFDNFAEDFDRILVEDLDYKVPVLLFEAAVAALPQGARGLNILDAGCGTGLAGERFRMLARRLEGIDLSREMVKLARARAVYDSLKVGELTRFLETTRARYDLIVAADVLVYLGDLAPVLSAASSALTSHGLLAFTVERHDQDGFALTASGRYAHDTDYVRRTAEEAGLTEISGRHTVLRSESGQPVAGYVAVYGME